jgi:aspartyl-tRNA(Asn)/glutamyl-tRNA(Gln) amidotransferase subunit A
MNEAVHYMSIGALSQLLRARETTPVEVINACLVRIDRLAQRLNTFATVLADQAREYAEEAEAEIKAGHWRGPLHGVPVGVKDFYDLAHVRTTAAFEKFKNRVPTKDAAGVAKLKEAGAIVVGKMNMHQLGMGTTGLDSYFGPVRNPWNDGFIPGGSSSGSAAAVAAGICYATLDTDAIGSCRLPAACCGVVGFKGTYGLMSAKGILEGEKADEAILWLSHPGIMTRSVEDTAMVLNVLAESNAKANVRDYRGDLSKERRLRVGIANNFKADREITGAFNTAVDHLRGLGHEVVAARAPFDIPPFGDLHAIETDRKTVSERAFGDIDILLLPTTATTVPTVKDAGSNPQALSAENTVFANYFGLPAVSVPCGFDDHGLPIGLQIVGKPWEDGTVLFLARQYEMTVEARKKHPVP